MTDIILYALLRTLGCKSVLIAVIILLYYYCFDFVVESDVRVSILRIHLVSPVRACVLRLPHTRSPRLIALNTQCPIVSDFICFSHVSKISVFLIYLFIQSWTLFFFFFFFFFFSFFFFKKCCLHMIVTHS